MNRVTHYEEPDSVGWSHNPPHHIRWMIRRDVPEVLEIDFHGSVLPWAEEDLLRVLRLRNCIGMVCEDWRIPPPSSEYAPTAGFMVYELHTDHLHLIRFAVHPAHQRLGFGRAMHEKVAKKLVTHRRTYLSASVLDSALDAQLFARACGWRAVGIDGDVYAMEYQ